MRRVLLFAVMAVAALAGTQVAHSQEISLATYRETAQVLIDNTISKDITASITLQSTSVQEIRVPAALEQDIREDARISAVIATNEEQCVLGVTDEACIMINVARNPEDTNFFEIQDTAKAVSAEYIDRINDALGTDAEFHSVFVHSVDTANRMLETSGVVSGGGAISAVYTMPSEPSDTMYEKMSSILLPSVIRESGGFYDVAADMSRQDNARVTFSIIPLEDKSLLQLKTTAKYEGLATDASRISPLEYLGVDDLERSRYFLSGFYPLNSVLRVVVLSPEPTSVSSIAGSVLETRNAGGEMVPTDVTAPGWVFDPMEGEKIQATWIFGRDASVGGGTVEFSLGGQARDEPSGLDESVMVVAIIVVVAAAAAGFYLKGYKKSH